MFKPFIWLRFRKEAECYNTSKALITDLYNKFPINGDEVIENKNIKTLSNFFLIKTLQIYL